MKHYIRLFPNSYHKGKGKTLTDEKYPKGKHSLIWNGTNDENQNVGSGVYFYKLNVNGKNITVKKCLLLK